jgi:hypothetical protein
MKNYHFPPRHTLSLARIESGVDKERNIGPVITLKN